MRAERARERKRPARHACGGVCELLEEAGRCFFLHFFQEMKPAPKARLSEKEGTHGEHDFGGHAMTSKTSRPAGRRKQTKKKHFSKYEKKTKKNDALRKIHALVSLHPFLFIQCRLTPFDRLAAVVGSPMTPVSPLRCCMRRRI